MTKFLDFSFFIQKRKNIGYLELLVEHFFLFFHFRNFLCLQATLLLKVGHQFNIDWK